MGLRMRGIYATLSELDIFRTVNPGEPRTTGIDFSLREWLVSSQPWTKRCNPFGPFGIEQRPATQKLAAVNEVSKGSHSSWQSGLNWPYSGRRVPYSGSPA